MSYIVIAKWIAQPGNEALVREKLLKLVDPTRREVGCLAYRPCESITNSREFVLFEEYVDEAAYIQHGESDHFLRYARREGIPLLEKREREFFRPLDGK